MRTISGNNLAQAIAETAMSCHFIELQFSGGTVRLTTAPVSITWGGYTWQGTGFALQLGPMEETADDKGQGVPLKLSGVDQTIISILLQQYARGRLASIWRGWFNMTSGALVDTPLLMFTGYLNETWEINETHDETGGPQSVEISTRVVSRLALFEQLRGIRCNLVSHQKVYTGDLIMQFVNAVETSRIEWPRGSYFKQ